MVVVSARLKNITQIGSFPQVGGEITKHLQPPPGRVNMYILYVELRPQNLTWNLQIHKSLENEIPFWAPSFSVSILNFGDVCFDRINNLNAAGTSWTLWILNANHSILISLVLFFFPHFLKPCMQETQKAIPPIHLSCPVCHGSDERKVDPHQEWSPAVKQDTSWGCTSSSR